MLGLWPCPFALAPLGARETCPFELGAPDTRPLDSDPFSAGVLMATLRDDREVRDEVVDEKESECGFERDVGSDGNELMDPDSALTSLVKGLTSRTSRTGAGLNRASIRDSVGRGPYARGRARMSKGWFSSMLFEPLLSDELLLDCKLLSTGAYKSSARGRVRYTSSCDDSRVATPARISPLGRGGAVNDGGAPAGSTQIERRSVALVLLSRSR
jgi:hypothetical protein